MFHRVSWLIALGALLFSAAGWADPIVIGFESPSYTVGNINGQQGWSRLGNYDAAVSSDGAFEGEQSLRISNGFTSGSFGDQTFTPHLGTPAGESTVAGPFDTFLASWYFKSVTGELQDGLGISVSADNGVGSRMTWIRMGDDAVDGMNLQFADYDQTQSIWVYHQLATNLDRTVWHRIDMRVYFQDGPSNDAVKIFLDGEYLLTGTTWEDFMRFPHSGGGGGGITPVNSILFRAGGAAAPSTLGQGFYIDNVSLESDTPEPGTAIMLLAGVAAVIVIARQQR